MQTSINQPGHSLPFLALRLLQTPCQTTNRTRTPSVRLCARIYNHLLQSGIDFKEAEQLNAAIRLETLKMKSEFSHLTGK